VIVWFFLWFRLLEAAPSITLGSKVGLNLSYGEAIEGRITSISKDCIVIRNSNGVRALDMRLVESLLIEDIQYKKEEVLFQIVESHEEKLKRPSNGTLITTGLLNAGVPLLLLADTQNGVGVTILDVAILGGGIYSIKQQPSAALPIFLGLGGLRLWAINESLSKAKTSVVTKTDLQCQTFEKTKAK